MKYAMCMASMKAQEGILSLIVWAMAEAIEGAKKMVREFRAIIREENNRWEYDWKRSGV